MNNRVDNKWQLPLKKGDIIIATQYNTTIELAVDSTADVISVIGTSDVHGVIFK